MGEIVAFSFASALNPTLLAATTVMLLLPRPEKLMLGYWLGAMATSMASGLLLIYALEGTGAAGTTKRTLTPVEDLVLAAAALIVAALLASGAVERARTRRATRRKEPKKSPKWEQRMRTGTSTTAFVLGVALSLLMLIYRTSHPQGAVLGQLPGTEAYRDVRRHPEALTFPGLMIWRAGGDLSTRHVEIALVVRRHAFDGKRRCDECRERRALKDADIVVG